MIKAFIATVFLFGFSPIVSAESPDHQQQEEEQRRREEERRRNSDQVCGYANENNSSEYHCRPKTPDEKAADNRVCEEVNGEQGTMRCYNRNAAGDQSDGEGAAEGGEIDEVKEDMEGDSDRQTAAWNPVDDIEEGAEEPAEDQPSASWNTNDPERKPAAAEAQTVR